MPSTISITAALKNEAIPLPAQAVLQMMIWAGLLEEREYVSSTGSGELKKFHHLTDAGLKFGVNASTLSPTKTEVKIYPSAIRSILIECHRAFGQYIESFTTAGAGGRLTAPAVDNQDTITA